MSENMTNPVTEPLIIVEEPSEKKSVVARAKSFVTKHKKPLIAVGLLGAVVGVSAMTGRQTTSTETLILEIEGDPEIEVVDSDTMTA